MWLSCQNSAYTLDLYTHIPCYIKDHALNYYKPTVMLRIAC